MAEKKESYDITKVGPLNWRQLKAENDGSMSEAQTVLALRDAFAPTRGSHDIEANAPQPVHSPLFNGKGDYWGNSHWDNDIATEEDFQHLGDIRAENQPWYIQASNGILKGGVLAGTTFVDGTVGLLAGVLVQGPINATDNDPNTTFLNGLWDNPITQAMNDINKWSEEAMPNYYTEAQQNGPWYSLDNLLSANFLFDKVVKNMGFMVGAAYSGGIYAKGVGLAARGIGGTFARAAAKNAGMTAEGIERAVRLGKQAADTSRASRAWKGTVGALFNAEAEATVEAVSNSDDFAQNMRQELESNTQQELLAARERFEEKKGKKLQWIKTPDGKPQLVDPSYDEYQQEITDIQKRYQATLAEIDNARKGMGTADFLYNIPILWAGDIVTLGKFYAGGWRAARTEAKTATRATKEAMAEAKAAVQNGDTEALKRLEQVVQKAERTGYQGLTDAEKSLVEEVQRKYILPKWMGYTGAFLKNIVKEGNEEMMQAAASRSAGYYYKDRLDAIYEARQDEDAEKDVISWWQATVQGMKDQYGDFNNYEEAAIGALTGWMGSPTLGRKNNSTNQTWLGKGKIFGFSGGSVTDVRDYEKGREKAEKTAAHITDMLKNPDLEDRLKHLVAQTKFEGDKQQAIIHDDKTSYKDAETAAIFEDVMYLKKAQRLDLLENAIKQMEMEFSDEEIKEIVDATTKQVSAYDERVQDKVKQRDNINAQIDKLEAEVAKREQELANIDMSTEEGVAHYSNVYNEYAQLNQQIKSLEESVDALNSYIESNSPANVSPYIKPDGIAMTADEVRADLKEKAGRIKQIVDDISTTQEEIDKSTGDSYTDQQLATLTWYSVMMRDWDRRSNSILDEVRAQLDNAINDPSNKAILQAIEALGDVVGSDGNPIYGGLKKGIKNWNSLTKELYNFLTEVINNHGADAGAALAAQLSNNKEIEVKKGDKKEKVEYGKYLLDMLQKSIEANPTSSASEVEIEYLKKQLEELRKLGEARRKYNELLEEYRKNPDKIDKAHEEIENKKERKKKDTATKGILSNFDFDGSIGDIAKTLEEQSQAIEDIGGFNALLDMATKDQQDKLRKARKMQLGLKSLRKNIDDSDMDDRIKVAANKLLDRKLPDSNSLQQLASALRESAVEPEFTSIPTELSEDFTILNELTDENKIAEIASAINDLEKRRDEEFEESIKRQAATTKEDANPEERVIPTDEGGRDISEDDVFVAPNEEEMEVEVSSDEDPNDDDEDAERIMRDNTDTSKSNSSEDTKLVNRRQLTESALSIPSMTLSDYYKDDKNMPSGLKKSDYAGFRKYIDAVSKYLKDNGAFTYMRNNLKIGDKIVFGTDENLNKDAGVQVVLMYAIDKDGQKHVVGSIRSEYEFQIYKAVKKSRKVKNTEIEAQEELYKAVLSGQEVSTTVESWIGGKLPLNANRENPPVKRIFGDKQPVLAVAQSGGNFVATENDVQVLSYNSVPGQVYLLIPTISGIYIPALCVSKKLKELPETDWYFTDVLVPALKEWLNNPNSTTHTMAKRAFSTRLRIQAYKDGKKLSNDSKEIPTHYDIGICAKKGDKLSAWHNRYEIPAGGFTDRDVLNIIKEILSKDQAKDFTTRFDIKRFRNNNNDYRDRITEYLFTNLMVGEIGQHSINDGFTYVSTDIEDKFMEKGRKRTAVSRTNQHGIGGNVKTTVTINGRRHNVTPQGAVENAGKINDDSEVTAAAASRIMENKVPVTAPKEPSPINELGGLADKRRASAERNATLRVGLTGVRKRNSGVKFMEAERINEGTQSAEERQHTLEEVRRMFPSLGKQGRIVVVNGMIRAINHKGDPVKAFGMFKDGILYISSESPKGTAYHESFHYVVDFLLDDAQKARMFEVAREQFGVLEELELEEKLAESFREFMNGYDDKSLLGRVKSFFRTLRRLINGLLGNEHYLDTLFYSIYRNEISLKDTEDNYQERLLEYKQKKLSYDNLEEEVKEYLENRKVSKDDYNKMTVEEKEVFIHCM